jgi:hypothetical protein
MYTWQFFRKPDVSFRGQGCCQVDWKRTIRTLVRATLRWSPVQLFL